MDYKSLMVVGLATLFVFVFLISTPAGNKLVSFLQIWGRLNSVEHKIKNLETKLEKLRGDFDSAKLDTKTEFPVIREKLSKMEQEIHSLNKNMIELLKRLPGS